MPSAPPKDIFAQCFSEITLNTCVSLPSLPFRSIHHFNLASPHPADSSTLRLPSTALLHCKCTIFVRRGAVDNSGTCFLACRRSRPNLAPRGPHVLPTSGTIGNAGEDVRSWEKNALPASGDFVFALPPSSAPENHSTFPPKGSSMTDIVLPGASGLSLSAPLPGNASAVDPMDGASEESKPCFNPPLQLSRHTAIVQTLRREGAHSVSLETFGVVGAPV